LGPTGKSLYVALVCGDGIIITPEETCDDGKDDNFGCNSTCLGALKGFDCNQTITNGT